MTETTSSEWTGTIDQVILGATKEEGGTRSCSYRIGGESDLPLLGTVPAGIRQPLIAFELCDDLHAWPQIVRHYVGDVADDPAAWSALAGKEYGADLIRLYLTSTHKRGFSDFNAVGTTVADVLRATSLPIIIEGSNEPDIDSEVFQSCGEAGQGERLLLGTAEASRYRSIAAAALAYGHSVVAQSPIDINLAKQLNILLRETGLPHDRIVIDPYTGALGYGFEYTYSVMERIRFAALKGDSDLAMPMICSAFDSLNVKEVRDAEPDLRDDAAVQWEFAAALAAAVAGSEIVCVRHPKTIPLLKEALSALNSGVRRAGGESP